MLVTVVLVACLLGDVASQRNPAIEKAAYQQLMVGCLGEIPYRQYLESVVAAGKECGGDVNAPGFLADHVNTLLNPSARLPSAQGISFPQSGGAHLQGPPGLSQQPGVFTPSGIFSQQAGAFSSQPGIFPQQSGTVFRQQQVLTHRPGIPTSQPGTFAQESGIFSSLDRNPVASSAGITDPVSLISSPVAPNHPGIRQKRQVTLNLADIHRTRVSMRALVNNFTCILTKLAVVTTSLDLNLRGLTNSVVNLPVAQELKRDLLTAINYCKDSTQCLPLERMQLPVPHKLKRVMEYVKCEKEMRLKACHKHNLRQNLQNINLGALPQDGNQFNSVEDIVNLMVDAQYKHELELI